MVEMHDVTIAFKNNSVFHNATYSFESNRIHGIVGRNGSGKSVLFRAICGLINPEGGHITVNGKIIGKDEEHPSSLGMIIETPAFLYSYSGYENLRILAGIKGIANDKRIRECMKCVELDPFSTKKVREYSLGMRQRLGIAQAIMEEPDLLVLDEPMNSLDEHSVQVVSQLIRGYKAGNATILLTSHHQSDIANLCDSVHTIQNGSILPLL